MKAFCMFYLHVSLGMAHKIVLEKTPNFDRMKN